jgi:hypothetical protein
MEKIKFLKAMLAKMKAKIDATQEKKRYAVLGHRR